MLFQSLDFTFSVEELNELRDFKNKAEDIISNLRQQLKELEANHETKVRELEEKASLGLPQETKGERESGYLDFLIVYNLKRTRTTIRTRL